MTIRRILPLAVISALLAGGCGGGGGSSGAPPDTTSAPSPSGPAAVGPDSPGSASGGAPAPAPGSRFDRDGTPIGSRIRVDEETDVAALGTSCTFADRGGVHPCPFPWQRNATVAGAGDGGFVVAWDTPDRQRPGSFVYARRFDAQGTPLGVATRMDAAATPESMPVARSVGAGFVITWAGQDADGSGIFAREFRSGALQ